MLFDHAIAQFTHLFYLDGAIKTMPRLLRHRLIILLLFVWICTGKVMAQHEYVVTVDPATGTISRFDSIPGVMYIAPHAIFDDKNRRFLFVGLPSDFSTHTLFSIDALTGKVITKALLPKDPTLISLRYDRSSGILYGITISSGIYSLVSVDANTGSYTAISSIKSMRGLAEEMIIDNNNHRIFLNCLDTSNQFALICIDVNGNLLSKVTIPNITGMQYDNSTNKLYGLHYTGTQEQLLQVDPSTGTTSLTGNLPPELFGILQFDQTFDEIQHRFILAGNNNSGVSRLYFIDVATGAVVYNPLVPASANAIDKDNVIQFRYSNSLNKLYALHWKGTPDTTAEVLGCSLDANTKIYQNPSGNLLTVNKTPTKCQVRIGLYTLLGQPILENKILSDGQNNILLPPLATGIYLYKFSSGNHILQTGKIMITHH